MHENYVPSRFFGSRRDPLYTLSLTSFLALYKWKVSNTQPHLVVKSISAEIEIFTLVRSLEHTQRVRRKYKQTNRRRRLRSSMRTTHHCSHVFSFSWSCQFSRKSAVQNSRNWASVLSRYFEKLCFENCCSLFGECWEPSQPFTRFPSFSSSFLDRPVPTVASQNIPLKLVRGRQVSMSMSTLSHAYVCRIGTVVIATVARTPLRKRDSMHSHL